MKVKYIEELFKYLEKNNIDKEEICITGAGVFSVLNIRENHDIEFIVKPKKYSNIKKWNQKKITNNIDYFSNFYGFCGISDSIVFSEHFYFEIDGIKYANIELQYLYKQELLKLMNRDKDKEDISLILSNYPEINKYLSNINILCDYKLRKNSIKKFRKKLLINRIKDKIKSIIKR